MRENVVEYLVIIKTNTISVSNNYIIKMVTGFSLFISPSSDNKYKIM
jgi:hypothetical protein